MQGISNIGNFPQNLLQFVQNYRSSFWMDFNIRRGICSIHNDTLVNSYDFFIVSTGSNTQVTFAEKPQMKETF